MTEKEFAEVLRLCNPKVRSRFSVFFQVHRMFQANGCTHSPLSVVLTQDRYSLHDVYECSVCHKRISVNRIINYIYDEPNLIVLDDPEEETDPLTEWYEENKEHLEKVEKKWKTKEV